jgi:threonine/homoserine/homoserine lactone efflux protein
MVGTFFLSMLVGFSGATIPGPLFAFTIRQALLVGWTAGLWLMVGHMIAEAALVTGLRYGLGRFLQRPLVTRVIGVVGGVVLLYIAWGMIATAAGGNVSIIEDKHAALTPPGLIAYGFLVTVTTPAWHIWWATAGMALVTAQVEKRGGLTWPVFFFGHSMADYFWYILISVLVSAGSSFLSPAVHRGIILFCGIAIAIIGVYFLVRPAVEWVRRTQQKADAGGDPARDSL